jgi:hypothetical protein
MKAQSSPHPLVPAEAGTQCLAKNWIPAFAGMSGIWDGRRARAFKEN